MADCEKCRAYGIVCNRVEGGFLGFFKTIGERREVIIDGQLATFVIQGQRLKTLTPIRECEILKGEYSIKKGASLIKECATGISKEDAFREYGP
jgi:hypothetical protein